MKELVKKILASDKRALARSISLVENGEGNELLNEIYKYTNNTPFFESDIDYNSLLGIYLQAQQNGDLFSLDNIKSINLMLNQHNKNNTINIYDEKFV